jgi:ATP-dependent Lon protease
MTIKKTFEKKGSKVSNSKNTKLRKNADSDSDEEFDSEDEDSDYETVDESESSYEPPKSKKSKKRVVESESEESEEDDEESDEEESPVNKRELQKIMSRIFPSKYMNEKVKNNEKSKKPASKKAAPSKKSKNSKKEESESEESEDSDDEEDEDDKGLYNIIFTIDDEGNLQEEEDEDEYNEEDDDVECDSEDEQTFMKESYQNVDTIPKSQSSDTMDKKKSKKHDKSSKKDDKKSKSKKDKDDKKSKDEDENENTDVEQEYLELVETKKHLTDQLRKRPKSKVLRHAVEDCNDSIKKLVKKARTNNAKSYHKLINQDKKRTNEVDYFKKKLSNKEQLRIMKDLKEINGFINIDKPYRLALLDSKIPAKLKAIALQKLNVLKFMDPGDNEYYKIKNWVDTFMRIPFGMYKNLSVKIDDGIDVCDNFMQNSMKILNDCVYGLNDAKLQIMQMVGQWISNPGAMGTAIAIKGPPGTGKTSLVKEGISKILGREFAFIALGGAGDSSFLEGHSYTYEGSSWGKIVQILVDSKCMNPVIYFDELDKISDTPRGEEIVGILTHLTDTSQNSQFHDKYFSDVDFDLSKCLFIFSYNDESKVNAILKDRMYRIQTKGYDAKEKVIIARDYILPKIREQVNFTIEDVIIPDETIQYIASNTSLTKEESGVRNLKRCLEIIYTKLNLFRLVKPGTDNIFAKDMDLKVSFPFTVTKKEVDIFIKNEDTISQSMLAMYC